MAMTFTMRETTLSGIELDTHAAEALPMDEEAFRGFYERTARAVWAYLTRVTGDRQLADDLLQETYYRFIRAGAAHESESHRRNSLFCIATNLARDSRRRGGNRVNVPLPDDSDGSEALPVVDNAAARAEGRTDLSRALAKLRPELREMLWLAYAHGSSHAEIAEAVGVKTASVKLMLFRARRKLAELLRSKP
jgi:RNA polymerase sigma-70 factor (ECF subfamily)